MRSFIDIIESAEKNHTMGCTCGFSHLVDETEELDEAMDANMQYDLERKYNEFNTKYFGGALPVIPLRWSNLKGKGGHVTYDIRAKAGTPARRKHQRRQKENYEYVPNSAKMSISKVYLKDEAALDGILIHEMIHVYMAAVAGLIYENHGPDFEKMRREISTKAGFEIPLTDNTINNVLNPSTKAKEYVVMIFERGDGSISYALLNKTATLKEETLVPLALDWAKQAKHFKAKAHFYLVNSLPWTSWVASSGIKEQRGKITRLYHMNPEMKDVLMGEIEKSTHLISVPPEN